MVRNNQDNKLTLERVERDKNNPFALFYDGICLPGQQTVELINCPGDVPRVRVEFVAIPGIGVKVIGD